MIGSLSPALVFSHARTDRGIPDGSDDVRSTEFLPARIANTDTVPVPFTGFSELGRLRNLEIPDLSRKMDESRA